MIMYKDDNILESLQYELYLFNAELNTVKTKLCLDEATIISRVREMYCTEEYVKPFTYLDAMEVTEGVDLGYPDLIQSIRESYDEYVQEGELTDKVKSHIAGVHNTGKYDVLKSQVTKAIKKAKNDSRLDAVQREINIAIANMDKVLKDKNPKYPNELKAYIRWLKNDTKELIKARRVEIKHAVSEIYIPNSDDDVRSELYANMYVNMFINSILNGTQYKCRSQSLNSIRQFTELAVLDNIVNDYPMIVRGLTNLKSTNPQFTDRVDEQIIWLENVYIPTVKDRVKELKNQINESALNDIERIQEGAFDTLVEIWNKIINRLKEIWNNFFGKAKQREDKITWLNENKNAILNNQYKGEKELPKFWERGEYYRSLTSKVPQFDYKSLKDKLDSDEAFISAFFGDLKQDGKSYNDVLRSLLYGEKQTIKDSQMPIPKMYQFCTNTHKQVVSLLDKSFKATVSGAEKFKSGISSGKIVAESVACMDRYFYSYLLEEVLYETDLSQDSSKEQSSNDSKSNDNNSSNSNNNSSDNNSSDKESNDLKKDEANNTSNDKKAVMDAQNKAQRCITICTNINGILMKACDDTFDTYFAILEEHAIRNGAKKRKLIKVDGNKK